MKNLKGLKFKAKLWTDSTKEVEGEIGLIDFKTLADADPKVNYNGYLMVIINDSGRNLVDPQTVELLDQLVDDLQECEGCSGKWDFDKMKEDGDGVPLCENCYDELQKEAATWICKVCDRKSESFVEGETWAEDNLCSTCDENDLTPG